MPRKKMHTQGKVKNETRQTKGNDFNAFFNLLQNAICKTAVIAHMFQFHSKSHHVFIFFLLDTKCCVWVQNSTVARHRSPLYCDRRLSSSARLFQPLIRFSHFEVFSPSPLSMDRYHGAQAPTINSNSRRTYCCWGWLSAVRDLHGASRFVMNTILEIWSRFDAHDIV